MVVVALVEDLMVLSLEILEVEKTCRCSFGGGVTVDRFFLRAWF